MNNSFCRLCLKNKPNMKAHIMAEGLLKLIHGQSEYDGRFILVATDSDKTIKRPTGSYDREILCDTCDNVLGSLDEEAINFCQRGDLKSHKSKAAFTLSDVDQKKLKLFMMSFAWRASITKLDEYKGVSLGEYHEELIRTMLLNSDTGGIDDYSVIVSKFSLVKERKKWGLQILNPMNNKLDGINIVDVYLPNLYKVIIKIDKRPFENNMNKMSLCALSEVFIFDIGDYTESQEFIIFHKMIMASKGRVGV